MAESMVKVRLRGPDVDEIETLWATALGEKIYRLENSPFCAYGVSWEDLIEAHQVDDEVPEFVRVIEKSGNRTIRVIFDHPLESPESSSVLESLNALGCTYEGMPPRLMSVNVPAESSLSEVTELLTAADCLKWEYADPTFEEITGECA